MVTLKTCTSPEIADRLVGPLAHWHHEDGFLCRRYRTGSWRVSLMVVNTIGHLAEAAWHHPDLEVSFPAVTVKLQTHDAGGITERDFELAARIESVIQWQPGNESSALTGPPRDDPRFRYLDYD